MEEGFAHCAPTPARSGQLSRAKLAAERKCFEELARPLLRLPSGVVAANSSRAIGHERHSSRPSGRAGERMRGDGKRMWGAEGGGGGRSGRRPGVSLLGAEIGRPLEAHARAPKHRRCSRPAARPAKLTCLAPFCPCQRQARSTGAAFVLGGQTSRSPGRPAARRRHRTCLVKRQT